MPLKVRPDTGGNTWLSRRMTMVSQLLSWEHTEQEAELSDHMVAV